MDFNSVSDGQPKASFWFLSRSSFSLSFSRSASWALTKENDKEE
jgi:hypothetical protein